ncbi:hypothetical protein ASE68_10640 [Agromyces sp. Leaf222]|nr:hypothetical protein ASE68_10640 [Agromyces sp. Leaf222]
MRRLYGHDAVDIEVATDTQRSRVADVLLTHPITQRRVAFEVQYAQLSVAEWRDRHESYVQQGIIDVWLWGHTRIRRARSEYALEPYRLDDVQDELRKAGMRVTFINPESSQLAIAVNRFGRTYSLASEREVDLVAFELESIRLSDQGVRSDAIDPFVTAAREREAALRERELEAQEHAEARAAIEAARAKKASARDLERARAAREQFASMPARVDARSGVVRPSVTMPARVLCRQCGKPLDATLAEFGVHLGPCRWEQERLL